MNHENLDSGTISTYVNSVVPRTGSLLGWGRSCARAALPGACTNSWYLSSNEFEPGPSIPSSMMASKASATADGAGLLTAPAIEGTAIANRSSSSSRGKGSSIARTPSVAAAAKAGGRQSGRYLRLDGASEADAGDDSVVIQTVPAAAGKQGSQAALKPSLPTSSLPPSTAAAVVSDDSAKKLGALAVAIISFGSVAGGPYGIEAAVGAAGALPTWLGCLALAFLWSAPQALVTAELATTFPSNGGYITWVVKGCGPVLGFVNAANCIASAVCNLPLYPVLFASYITSLYPQISEGGVFGIKLAGLILTVALNVAGIQAVEVASLIFTCIVQTPFILMPIAAKIYGKPTFDWKGGPMSLLPGWKSGFAVFVSTLCWNAQGWPNVGNLAGEVRNPQRSYPLGSALAVFLVALNYIYPVVVCAALAPDATQWDTGYFATIGQSISPWLGAYTTFASVFSSANNFLPQMGTTARALRYAALYKMAPLPFLSYNWGRSGAPVAAILLQGLICGVLMNFSFDALVIINVLFFNVGLMLQFGAFLVLKHTAPDIHRPFVVPGGKPGALLTSLLFFVVLATGFYAATISSAWAMVVLVGCNVGFLIGGMIWAKWGYDDGLLERVEAAEAAANEEHSRRKAERQKAKKLKAAAAAGGGKKYGSADDDAVTIVDVDSADAEAGTGAGGGKVGFDSYAFSSYSSSVQKSKKAPLAKQQQQEKGGAAVLTPIVLTAEPTPFAADADAPASDGVDVVASESRRQVAIPGTSSAAATIVANDSRRSSIAGSGSNRSGSSVAGSSGSTTAAAAALSLLSRASAAVSSRVSGGAGGGGGTSSYPENGDSAHSLLLSSDYLASSTGTSASSSSSASSSAGAAPSSLSTSFSDARRGSMSNSGMSAAGGGRRRGSSSSSSSSLRRGMLGLPILSSSSSSSSSGDGHDNGIDNDTGAGFEGSSNRSRSGSFSYDRGFREGGRIDGGLSATAAVRQLHMSHNCIDGMVVTALVTGARGGRGNAAATAWQDCTGSST